MCTSGVLVCACTTLCKFYMTHVLFRVRVLRVRVGLESTTGVVLYKRTSLCAFYMTDVLGKVRVFRARVGVLDRYFTHVIVYARFT